MTDKTICCGRMMTGVQYQGTREDYDGISEWVCGNCGERIGRWTGHVLIPGEIEPRYGISRHAESSR